MAASGSEFPNQFVMSVMGIGKVLHAELSRGKKKFLDQLVTSATEWGVAACSEKSARID